MVQLHCLPARGNAGGRYFPHSGFLGLTQVKLEGVVRTRLDDDRRPLLVNQLTVAVRCYEARVGRIGVQSTNVLAEYAHVLWPRKGDEADEPVPLGDSDHPFRIVIPARCPGGQSTAHFQNYRIYWRIEATCIHQPVPGLGTRMFKAFDLLLTRYDAVLSHPPHPSHSHSALVSTLRKPRCPSLNYAVTLPTAPIGPLDIVPITVRVRPLDDRIAVSLLSLSIERRIRLHDSPASSPAADAPAHITDSLSSLSVAASTVPFLAGRSTPSIVGGKATTFVVASAEASSVLRDEFGFFYKTLHAPLPAAKTANHWALGETLYTALATIGFFVRIKVTLSTGDVVELDEQELQINATNTADRDLVIAKHPELFEKHRRRTSGVPSSPKSTSSGSRSSRRPHTSAGDSARRSATVPRSMGRSLAMAMDQAPPPVPPAPVLALDPAVAAWEQELERIECQSRHRSAEASAARKRTKLAPAVAVA